MTLEGLKKTALFRGFTDEDLEEVSSGDDIRIAGYRKNENIFSAGDIISEMGVVLSGKVIIENNDFWGNRTILSSIPAGGVFGETYALAKQPLMVDAVTSQPSRILLIETSGLIDASNVVGSWQNKLVKNLLRVSINKSLTLSTRIFCTTPKKIRNRLLIFLSGMAVRYGKSEFEIPFDRQQLAAYLNLDRSALSKELRRMEEDGILEYNKSHFILHSSADFVV
ncbi:MAG: Crp/Fnr family transcriptional regulator [Anaerovoracaceae bacterium]|jgi:CRP-like cAMP-binding protein